jgi:LmbE family N-acetylglucosaminyl deacetylase
MQYEQLNNLQTRVLFVVAHPDDEVVGAGGSLLSRFQETHVVHVTDGAPTDMLDAHRNSFATRHDYAQARRQEALAALALAGISEDRVIELGVTDQNSAYQLVSITLKLAELFTQLKPQLVITQPYEGGHPDHDATAFAVHHARRLLDENETAPDVFEMTSYHERDESVVYSEFLPDEGSTPMTVVLTAVQQTLKRSMFDCFQSQRDVLRWFPIELERFRRAPAYDFRHAPHAGSLYYEHFDWGMTGPEWLQLARQAHGVLEQGGIHDARSFERGVSAGAGGAGRNRRSRTDPDLSRRRTRQRRTSLNSHRL